MQIRYKILNNVENIDPCGKNQIINVCKVNSQQSEIYYDYIRRKSDKKSRK